MNRPRPTSTGRWGVRQQLSDERWGGGTINMGYERREDAEADAARMGAFGYKAEVYDRHRRTENL